MASRYEKFTILVDPNRRGSWLKCVFCGRKWSPGIKSDGRLVRNAYMCPNGCTKDYGESYKRLSRMTFKKNHLTGKFEPIEEPTVIENK